MYVPLYKHKCPVGPHDIKLHQGAIFIKYNKSWLDKLEKKIAKMKQAL